MTNLLDRFNQNVIGSKGKIADYTSSILSSGDFTRVLDINAILTSWNTILLTPKRSYQYDPEFGSDLYKMPFEPSDELTVEKIENEIISSLTTHDDRANIADVNITFLSNLKGFNIDVKVEYNEEEADLKLTIDESSFFNFMGVTST